MCRVLTNHNRFLGHYGMTLPLGTFPCGSHSQPRCSGVAEPPHNPRNPRVLFGLWHSLKAQHNTVAASWVQQQFEDAWKNADSQLRIEDF